MRLRVAASLAVLAAVVCCATSASLNTGGSPQLDYGTTVLAGGYFNYESSDIVEVIKGDELPNLPAASSGSSLTAVGSVLYSCGGNDDYQNLAECYTLDTHTLHPQWRQNVSLPVPMDYHTATTVGSHIWFIYENTLYDLDTQTDEFTEHSLPFEVRHFHCAVADERHVYVIGAGISRNEIYINIQASDPTQWEKQSIMEESHQNMACLLFDREIFITGGLNTEGKVSIFDMESRVFHFSRPLNTPRLRHGMFVYQGRPAVVAGCSHENVWLNSVETYNVSSNSWTVESLELTQARDNFGLAQFTY